MKSAFVAIALLMPVAAHAHEPDQVFIFGQGVASCGTVVAAADGERHQSAQYRGPRGPGMMINQRWALYATYLQGFLSGANMSPSWQNAFRQDPDIHSRMLFIENWCRSNPLRKFIDAIFALMQAEKEGPARSPR